MGLDITLDGTVMVCGSDKGRLTGVDLHSFSTMWSHTYDRGMTRYLIDVFDHP